MMREEEYVDELEMEEDNDDGDLALQTRPPAITLGSFDYHDTLRDGVRGRHHHSQTREFGSSRSRPCSASDRRPSPDPSASKQDRPKSAKSTRKFQKKRSRAKSRTQIAHPLSREEIAEFEALPWAIRRKYFSTLERVRIAQTLGLVTPDESPEDFYRADGQRQDYFHDHLYPPQSHHTGRVDCPSGQLSVSLPTHNTEPRWSSDHLADDSEPNEYLSPFPPGSDDPELPELGLHPRQRVFTIEQQIALAVKLREGTLLDVLGTAAKEPTNRQEDLSCDGLDDEMASEETNSALGDSLKWLDEEDELDLKLCIEDYHRNLREALPENGKERRPTYRRHMSISKLPFRRISVSANGNGIKEGSKEGPTPLSPASSQIQPTLHGRRKSRALSLMTPKQAETQHPIALAIDHEATHYQDPEAREKLRCVLASPQKFDEAIEFGFPSNEERPSIQPSLPQHITSSSGRAKSSHDNVDSGVIPEDGHSLTSSEDVSMIDPDSPRTPHTPEKNVMKLQPSLVADEFSKHLPPGSSSREMTLRMTLTRSDLRADDGEIYGWQKGAQRHGRKKSVVVKCHHEGPVTMKEAVEVSHIGPENLDKFFASLDDEIDLEGADGSVMKRFWNRVRRT